MTDDRLPWDPFQRDVLDALGHVVYATREAMSQASDSDETDADAPPLMRAIARAAKANIAQLPALPPLAQLRTPGAKRALWPRLRALRKGSRA
jgi:hypothetical protein